MRRRSIYEFIDKVWPWIPHSCRATLFASRTWMINLAAAMCLSNGCTTSGTQSRSHDLCSCSWKTVLIARNIIFLFNLFIWNYFVNKNLDFNVRFILNQINKFIKIKINWKDLGSCYKTMTTNHMLKRIILLELILENP